MDQDINKEKNTLFLSKTLWSTGLVTLGFVFEKPGGGIFFSSSFRHHLQKKKKKDWPKLKKKKRG